MKYFLRHLVPGVKGTSQMEEVHRLRVLKNSKLLVERYRNYILQPATCNLMV